MNRDLLILDNYDSFTYNLAQALGKLGAPVRVLRSDAVDSGALRAHPPAALVISPGPGHPESAGNSVRAIRALTGWVPILGVCLGHQAIGACFGARIVRGAAVHGKTSLIEHGGDGLFAGVPNPFVATRYHSLVVDEGSLPDALHVTARCALDGSLMAIAHRADPTFGVQFHPESVLTRYGARVLENFLRLAGMPS